MRQILNKLLGKPIEITPEALHAGREQVDKNLTNEQRSVLRDGTSKVYAHIDTYGFGTQYTSEQLCGYAEGISLGLDIQNISPAETGQIANIMDQYKTAIEHAANKTPSKPDVLAVNGDMIRTLHLGDESADRVRISTAAYVAGRSALNSGFNAWSVSSGQPPTEDFEAAHALLARVKLKTLGELDGFVQGIKDAVGDPESHIDKGSPALPIIKEMIRNNVQGICRYLQVKNTFESRAK